MANSGRPTYRLNLNRNPTEKWAKAQQVDYDGDDWGEDDYDDYGQPEPEPVSAGPQRHPGWGQNSGQFPQRGITNPSNTMGPGRHSFDRDEERRYFSTGAPESEYQRQQSMTPSQHYGPSDQSMPQQANIAPLHVDTHVSRPLQSAARSDPRATPYSDAHGVPYSAPVGRPPQRLQAEGASGYRNVPVMDPRLAHQHNTSQDYTFRQPPGGSSLSQQPTTSTTSLTRQAGAREQTDTVSNIDQKPLPFIRPADIYKRIEEEREKERRSQESARPSIDSGSSVRAASPTRPGNVAASQQSDHVAEELGGSSRKTKPMLDTVDERRSESGISPTSAHSSRSTNLPFTRKTAEMSTTTPTRSDSLQESRGPQPVSRTASSVYTDRPDPVSASSTGNPYSSTFTTTRSPVSEPPRQGALQYSPSMRKPSGLRTDTQEDESGDDLPNFDHAVSPSHSITSETVKSVHAEGLRARADSSNPESGNLQHEPEPAYKAAVKQAFDTGRDPVMSPSRARGTLSKSDNSSASDIGPTIARKPAVDTHKSAERSLTSTNAAPIFSHDRSESTATVKAMHDPVGEKSLPTAIFVSGHSHEDNASHARDNKVRRPTGVEIPAMAEAQRGVLSSTTAPSTSTSESSTQRLPQTQYDPVDGRREIHQDLASPADLAPPSSASRSASEDYQEWQTQRQQFKEKHGIEDSNTASPAVSSPVSRAESPAKGTVRDIAERLESNSGRSSPANVGSTEARAPIVNKPLNIRNDSFRPNLPGGWQSYTTDASSSDNVERSSVMSQSPQPTKPLQAPTVHEVARTQSTESVPTAVAPRGWKPPTQGPAQDPFAAAAAAGNAMLGAFSGSGLTRDHPQFSDVSSEDEGYSEDSQPSLPHFSQSRDFASTTNTPQTHSTSIGEGTAARPATAIASNFPNHTEARSNDTADFPAPLRTTRLVDNKQPSSRLSMPVFAADHDEQDPEQLQHDIVQSLTPKGSNIDSPKTLAAETTPTAATTREVLPQRSSQAEDDHDVLPQEYSSYWNDRESQPKRQSHLDQTDAERSALLAKRPPIPDNTVGAASTTDTAPLSKPFLETRYSWETPLNNETSDNSAGAPMSNFAKGVATNKPSTAVQSLEAPPSTVSPPAPIVHNIEGTDTEKSENMRTPVQVTPAQNPTLSAFPAVKTEFRNILDIKDSSQRIRAFNENRQTYAQPTGLLDQWLSSMNTSEHSDVFNTSRLPQMHSAPGTIETRPSPRRDMPSASGTKLMQEDGRRLLAAAGKYSGIAGTAAKGFFSKHKDKLRTASSGDKVYTRRSSSATEINTLSSSRTNYSVLSEKAPQLPTPSLETPPERSWSTLLSSIDPDFSDRTQQSRTDPSPMVSPIATRGLASKADMPPASVVATIPGNRSSAANAQSFPNYGAATASNPETTAPASTRQSQHFLGQDQSAVVTTGAGSGHFTAPPRVDSLPVPHHRRPSTVSDVSEISVVPDETSDVVPRTVSPALESQTRDQGASVRSPQQQHIQKEQEAQRDRTSTPEGTLPAYTSGTDEAATPKQSQISHGAHIIPIVGTKPINPTNQRNSSSRPFSFTGSETLDHALSQQAGLKPQAANGQTSSAVTPSGPHAEKSPQVSVTEHPAYRDGDQTERSFDPDDLLPSARRHPHDLVEQGRQHQQTTQPSTRADEGYRIPGPYVQEFRSPRPSNRPDGEESTQTSSEDGLQQSQVVPNTSQNRLSRIADGGMTNSSGQMVQRPVADRSKSRTLSSMFRTKSGSPTRHGQSDGAYGSKRDSDYTVDESGRRSAQPGQSNRPYNPSRQYSGERPGYGSRADSSRGRKLSFDMLRSSTPRSKTPTDNKKKRSSGIGAFFGRFGREKDTYREEQGGATTMSPNAHQYMASYNQPSSGQMQDQSPYPISAADYHYRPSNVEQGIPSQHNHYSPHNRQSTEPVTSMVTPQAMSGPAYHATMGQTGHTGQHNEHGLNQDDGWQSNPNRPHVYTNPPENAIVAVSQPQQPQRLNESATQPFTASPTVPVTRANRDISYGQDRPYMPPSSPLSPSGSSLAQPSAYTADHVKNLHKRSRSPRLGRPPSDEHLRGASIDQNRPDSIQHLSAHPANQLGTFSNRRASPEGGIVRPNEDQERPWTIGLPDNGDEENGSRPNHQKGHATGIPHGGSSIHTNADNNLISSITPHQHNQYHQRDHVGNTTLPTAATGTSESARVHDARMHHEESVPTSRRDEVVESSTVPKLAVPPTLSSAARIPDPVRHSHEGVEAKPTTLASSSAMPPTSPTSPESRRAKQAHLERSGGSVPASASTTSRPLTVAEKVMGVQPEARGTIPEHRSTTPTARSPATPMSAHQKATIWPEERATTTGVSTANTGMGGSTMTNSSGTTVVTTTMRSGSKLGKGGMRTSTYMVESNAPSRTGSVATARSNRTSTINPLGATPSASTALAPKTSNLGSKRDLQTSTGSRSSVNTAGNLPAGKSFDAVELPGSRPDGYESEEEIVMSATAYPGQEWMPEYAVGANWDD